MTQLDLHDIQGNIVKAYGRYGYPKGRYFCFRIHSAEEGRAFVRGLLPLITTSAPWASDGDPRADRKPPATTNVAFTYRGLEALSVPTMTLHSFPDAFAMGMRARRDILGDDAASAPERWDPIWQGEEPTHVLVWINGKSEEAVERRYQEILALRPSGSEGVELLHGHRGPEGRDDLAYQAASAIYIDGEPSAQEHFGYVDGISNPFFKGTQSHGANVIGGGKPTRGAPNTREGWEPLETGEFLLGHKDEAFEYPEAPDPPLFARNGTFMVVRKLHENVATFDAYLEHVGREYPAGKEALAAKLAGRWRNGAPLMSFPSEDEARAFAEQWQQAKRDIAKATSKEQRDAAKARFAELNLEFVGFDYDGDIEGGRCPIGAHVRRANPRGALELDREGAYETRGAVTNRRRILRRGLPYGDSHTRREDGDEHGIIFMAINSSIRRQFEFVQQQWMNYGNDFRLANDMDPLVGSHPATPDGKPGGRMVIGTAASEPNPPFFCSKLPRFVETRGGDYYFVPSLTALRMIARGNVDPT